MLYAILGYDAEQTLPKRRAARTAHLERLRELQTQGRLLLAGPRPAVDAENPGEAGFVGSLIVAEFADLDAARAWVDQDPYVRDGVFERVEVTPFLKVFPA